MTLEGASRLKLKRRAEIRRGANGFLSYGRNHFRPFDLTSWQAKAGLFWGNKQPFPGSRQKRTERRRQVVETPAAEGKHSSEAKGGWRLSPSRRKTKEISLLLFVLFAARWCLIDPVPSR